MAIKHFKPAQIKKIIQIYRINYTWIAIFGSMCHIPACSIIELNNRHHSFLCTIRPDSFAPKRTMIYLQNAGKMCIIREIHGDERYRGANVERTPTSRPSTSDCTDTFPPAQQSTYTGGPSTGFWLFGAYPAISIIAIMSATWTTQIRNERVNNCRLQLRDARYSFSLKSPS